MIYLKADTNTEVLIGPAVAVGDGFTPVTTLALSTADEAELIKYGATTPLVVTSISASAMTAITDADGYYTLDLSTSNTDTEGFLVVVINDDSLILPIRQEFTVVNANVYDSLFAAAATDLLQVDLTQVVGSTTNVSDMASERGKYAGGAVWIGPTANTNTVSYVDGIITNPVSTIAAAKTVADALKLKVFHTVRTGTSQVAAAMTGYEFTGDSWSLTTSGGSQDVGTSVFRNAELAGGTFAGTSGRIIWDKCSFPVAVSAGISTMNECLFGNTLTLSEAGDYNFIDCASIVAGAGAPTFALGTGIFNISFRRWSGGITFSGVTADDVMTISGELGTIDLGSPSGAADIQIRGTYKAITNIGSAVVNLTGAILAADVAAILVDTAVIGAAGVGLTDLGGMSTTMKAQVNTEVVDVVNVDTLVLPGQAAPSNTPTMRETLGWLYKNFRNRKSQTATTWVLYADNETTVDNKSTVSDDATTAIKQEVVSGP
jgi:hypothetical protein